MKPIYGWWFSKRKVLPHGDGRRIRVGRTHKVTPPVRLYKHGLHLSIQAIDALRYANGSLVWRVAADGDIVRDTDKVICSERTYIAGGVDATNTLQKFARLCALDVIHLWDAPDVVLRYLRTGDELLRDAAWDAAWSAAREATWAAAWSATWAADRAAAWNDAWNAALAAALATAREATRDAQNRRLTRMLRDAIRNKH